jgi:putative ABC transport system ATP-binding protein
MHATTIDALNITKTFESGSALIPVISNLSVEIARGELTLIAGPSGCGKSTLLAILSGLLRPDSGRVRCLGIALEQCTSDELDAFRLQHTGFVFQGFNLFPALTAVEQVELPLQYLKLSTDEAHRRATRALDQVGLASHASFRPNELSGGQKQRVAVARAIAKEPQLLFADEPTSSLDAANGQVIINLLHQVARSSGVAVVCASHDPRLARHAECVLHMEDGRILARSVSDARSSVPHAIVELPA